MLDAVEQALGDLERLALEATDFQGRTRGGDVELQTAGRLVRIEPHEAGRHRVGVAGAQAERVAGGEVRADGNEAVANEAQSLDRADGADDTATVPDEQSRHAAEQHRLCPGARAHLLAHLHRAPQADHERRVARLGRKRETGVVAQRALRIAAGSDGADSGRAG